MVASGRDIGSSWYILAAATGAFLVGSAITTAAFRYCNSSSSSSSPAASFKNDKRNLVPGQNGGKSALSTASTTLPPEIRLEQLSRHLLYFGDSGMQTLAHARVCVVGVGGVGSHAAHLLARSGVRYIRIIDFDQVSLSSLNRHACATLSDVGTSKVECLAHFLRRICPDPKYLEIDARQAMFTETSSSELLKGSNPFDMVLDCIDDVPTKAALISYCIRTKIRVVSCMGAGSKADFTRLHVSDLASASRDPLASKLRQTLKQKLKTFDTKSTYLEDMNVLTILFSSEKAVVKLADFTDEQKEIGVHQFGAVDGMRIRILPVLGTMPAIMGDAMACVCLTELTDQKLRPVTGERIGRTTRHKLYQKLVTREQHLTQRFRQQQQLSQTNVTPAPGPEGGEGELLTIKTINDQQHTVWIGDVQIDTDDVEYVLEIWRNRCAVTGQRLGTVLNLVRWDLGKPSTTDNLIVIAAHLLKEYDVDAYSWKDHLDPHVRQRIEERLATCRVPVDDAPQ
jgi:tRNA A37 threonylcarbamoyladenosine dehydratase